MWATMANLLDGIITRFGATVLVAFCGQWCEETCEVPDNSYASTGPR